MKRSIISAGLVSKLAISLAALTSLMVFSWPLFISSTSTSEVNLAQSVFIALMPAIILLVLVEFSTGEIGSKQLAMLGVLAALNAVVRLLGAGVAGIETAFFIIIIGAVVFGAGFGYLLGASSILVSALLSGGIGPWLPFQMMAAGLIGLGAGVLPRFQRRWAELATLCTYAVIASFGYGALMTLWNWPFLAGVGSDVSYLAGAGVAENLIRFLKFELATVGLAWDLGRAITTVVLIALTSKALLATLRRAAGRAGFEAIR